MSATPGEAIGEFCGRCGALTGACVNRPPRGMEVTDQRDSFRLTALRDGNRTRIVTSEYVRENLTRCNCPPAPRRSL